MLDAGGGGGGTPWWSMSLPEMRAIVQQHSDTPANDELLTGWRRSYELIIQHMSRVRSYRDNLAAAWPPEKSPAAAAYVARLDMLLESLQETYDAAVANYGAFAGVTGALASARGKIEKLHEEWTANQQLLLDFEEQKREREAQPVLSKWTSPPLRSPVAAGRQEELENEARITMAGLGTEIVQARAALVQPKPYTVATRYDDQSTPFDPYGGGTALPLSPVPPPMTNPRSSKRPPSQLPKPSPTSPVHGQPIKPTIPVPAPIDAPEPRVVKPGPVLNGAGPQTLAPPTSTPLTPPLSGGGPTSQVIGGSPLPNVAGPNRPAGGPALPPPNGPGSRGLPPSAVPAAPTRPPAGHPGGIIGGTPGAIAQPNQGRGTQRVNPIGGMIGQPSPGGTQRQNLTTASASAGMPPASVGNRRNKPEESEGPRWDPDNPWETAEGVDPILLPPIDKRIDPGPAIGLR